MKISYLFFCATALFKVQAIGPLGGFGVNVGGLKCEQTLTTATGAYTIHKANGQFCSGDLIFEDTFDTLDTKNWQHESTLSGNGVTYLVQNY